MSDHKVQQAEEAFTHAKQLYDEITDELYEELPTFYDRCVCVCVCVCVVCVCGVCVHACVNASNTPSSSMTRSSYIDELYEQLPTFCDRCVGVGVGVGVGVCWYGCVGGCGLDGRVVL